MSALHNEVTSHIGKKSAEEIKRKGVGAKPSTFLLKPKSDEPVLYCLQDGPKRGFVREELLVVPPTTELPTTIP